MNEFIYIISTQSGQGSPEIFSIWSTYESAIIAYYQVVISKEYSHDFTLKNYYLYKMPINEKFCEDNHWSDIKLQKSCKYRIKFKDYNELKKIYDNTVRKVKIDSL